MRVYISTAVLITRKMWFQFMFVIPDDGGLSSRSTFYHLILVCVDGIACTALKIYLWYKGDIKNIMTNIRHDSFERMMVNMSDIAVYIWK